jgi:hypothetical protein
VSVGGNGLRVEMKRVMIEGRRILMKVYHLRVGGGSSGGGPQGGYGEVHRRSQAGARSGKGGLPPGGNSSLGAARARDSGRPKERGSRGRP